VAATEQNPDRLASASMAVIGLSSHLSSHSNGLGMKDDQGRRGGQTGASPKDSRQDRLKLALRENLKRRKSQVRGRGDAAPASSEDTDAALDDAGGKQSGR
jgi:hypothetical protein